MGAVGEPSVNGEAGMELSYLIRYGLWHQVGRFASDSPDLERGETVVVRSHRGTELGEVLIKVETPPGNAYPPSPAETARVLRAANGDDLDRARQLELERPRRFDLCQRVIQDREEALELIDVEPLLDDRRTVLHYLGPHQIDLAGLLATLHSTCNIDVLLEPVGRDVSDDQETSTDRSRSELRTLRVGWRRLWVGLRLLCEFQLLPRWLFRLRDKARPRRQGVPFARVDPPTIPTHTSLTDLSKGARAPSISQPAPMWSFPAVLPFIDQASPADLNLTQYCKSS